MRGVTCILIALLGGPAVSAWGQANSAVVTGTDRVFVRRGPGTEFPAFATLTRGTTVEVQEMQGEWSRVTTTAGQVGYIHSNFLALPAEAGSRAAPDAPPSQPTAQPTARSTVRPEPALNTLTEKNKALEAQVAALQEELAVLKTQAAQVPPPAPTPVAVGAEGDDVRAELKRLTAAVEGLQQHVGGAPNDGAAVGGASAVEAEQSLSSTALVLGGAGLLLGWLLGAAYGRNQERGRRSRIRF